ncbi:MAG: PfkB family carbohydrate kinase [Vulcanimicrobiaceae bacterium]
MSKTPAPAGTFVGMTTLDLIYEVESVPRSNQKLRAKRQAVVAGGPAANAAVAFSALGGAATLATALGGGPLVAAVRADLSAQRVRLVDGAAPDDTGLPVSTVLVTAGSGERAVVSIDGRDRVARLQPEARDAIAKSAVVLCDGNYPELALAAARQARAHGVTNVLDGGSWKTVLPELLPLVDVAICSADFSMPGVQGEAAMLEALLSAGIRLACVTHGAEPVVWRAPHGSGRVAVPQRAVVDTLAAGDVFHGAFCYALASSPRAAEPAALLTFAAEIASFSTRFFGSREWIAVRSANS